MQRKRDHAPGGRSGGGPRGAGSLAFLLAQVGAHAASRFAERLAPLGLAPQHAGILRMLGSSAGLSQRELAGRLGILPSRLVALMDELEEKGFVERKDDPGDRRSYALQLTDRGRATLDEIGRVAREHGDAICAALSEVERDELAKLLRRMAEEQGLTPGVHPGYRRL